MPVRVGRIDFINTEPVYYGIDKGLVHLNADTVCGSPAALNRLLAEKKIQISAISSIAYARAYPDWLILPDLSISSRGPVGSVFLCARKSLESGSRLFVGLTDKSATSKALVRIVLEDHHAVQATYRDVDLSRGLPDDLDALLVIGDDAFKLNLDTTFPIRIDLGEFWLDATGLPFVFGLWAVDRAFAREHRMETAQVADALVQSKNLGQNALTDAARLAAKRAGVPEPLCHAYLEHIEYGLEADHLAGLIRFFQSLKRRGEIDEAVELAFWHAPGLEASLEA